MTMTKQEIAKELLDPYFINPDLCSFDGDDCLYSGPGGRKCVFASACVDGARLREDENATYQLLDQGEKILKEKYRHIVNGKFWDNLQFVHDTLASGKVCDPRKKYRELTGQNPPGEQK